MKKIRITLLIFIILMNSMYITGCWNYREVDKLLIVAGSAIDKGTNNQIQLTAEIIEISTGKDAKMTSKTVTSEGKTMFDAARNMISISGKRLYWSHAKVVIISKEIASEGVTKVIDFYNRDSETREDVNILISEGASAKEILVSQGITEDIKSFTLAETIKNEVSLNQAPIRDMLHFDIELRTKELAAIVPAIKLKELDGKMVPQIIGTAIIKNHKLVGFLDGEETKTLIFIRNEVKDGILVQEMKTNAATTLVSLEIYKNKTKVKPVVNGKNIKFDLDINTIVAIDEISSKENFIDEEGRKNLEQSTEKMLRQRIEALIKKIQSEYDADIFEFGIKLHEGNVKTWKNVEKNWEETFKALKVNVKIKVHIKNSSMLSKTLEEGE